MTSALAIPECLEPLAVWDTRDYDGAWWWLVREGLKPYEWAQEHIREPNSTYRVDFYLFDGPFAVVHRYARDEDGRLYGDGAEPVKLPPVVQPLDELPPAHLLRQP